jgi:hypothetical protein
MLSSQPLDSACNANRLSEIASILAGGILRLEARSALSNCGAPASQLPDSRHADLDVSPKTVLSVHTG